MWDASGTLKKRMMSTLLLLTAIGVLFLYNWTTDAKLTVHVEPAAEWCDINEALNKMELGMLLSEKDLQVLSGQTGLGEDAINKMVYAGLAEKLSAMQNIYFAPVTIEEYHTTPLTVSEWLAGEPIPGYEGMPIVDIQNGDILITKNSRFLGWRNGHAGLVIDAEMGLVLEAIMLGSPSQVCRISKWEKYPSFLVLRLKEEYMVRGEDDGSGGIATQKMGTAVAEYASQELLGVPYKLLAGLYKAEPLTGTQCAHLVWYAYKQFGIDLDSDGGFFVTPYDIQNSPYLEVVQSYGY